MKKDKKKLESTEEIFSSEEWNAAFSGTDAVEVGLIADQSRQLASKLLPHSKLDKELDKPHSKLDKEPHSKLDKEKSILYQLDKETPTNWITTEQQPHSKLDKQPHSKLDTKLDKEPHSKLDKMALKAKKRTVREVVGIQRKILLRLHQITQQNGGRETPVFTRKSLSEELSVNYFSVRTAIQRFREWGILENVTSSKGGRNAPVIVTFSFFSFQELNWITTEQQPHSKLDSKLDKTSPSSSSYINNINSTTTTGEFEPELIDSSPLNVYGFGINHVKQCLEKNWGFDKHPVELQQSIFHIKAAIDKGILATPKGPGLIMEQLKRGKYHASEIIKSNKISEYLDKVKPWWDSLPMDKRTKFQNENNFERIKSNDEKWTKIVAFYEEETFKNEEIGAN